MARLEITEEVNGVDNALEAAEVVVKQNSHLFNYISYITVSGSLGRIDGQFACWDVKLEGERGPVDG